MNDIYNIDELLVSIITPAFNCEKYIGECIDSVINQTHQNWEMIIVNDNSIDRTLSIIDEYAKIDSRIKVYSNNHNEGASISRNKAIGKSKGRFIAFLDSDDLWEPNKLKKQITFMLKNQYGFTFTSYEIMKGSRNGNKIVHVPSKINYNQYLKNTIIGCLTVMMDKEILGLIRVEYGELEDVLTWMKYLKDGHLAYGLNENLAKYRVTKQSISGNKFKNAIRYFECLRKKQNLSLLKCLNCQVGYMYNATKKRFT